MANNVFKNSMTLLMPSGAGSTEGVMHCSVKVSGIPNFNYVMMGRASGGSNARTQIDIALDGSMYVTGTTNDVGEYLMQFYDGPVGCGTDSSNYDFNAAGSGSAKNGLAAAYFSSKKLEDRKVTITLYSVTGGTVKTANPSATLTGVISQISVELEEHQNALFYRTALKVTGVWSK